MLRLTAFLGLVLSALAFPQPLFAAGVDLQPSFAAAAKDPARVAALITQGSVELQRLLAADPAKAAQLGDALEPFCKRMFFSPENLAGAETFGIVVHEIAKGDNPTKIVSPYRIGAGMLGYLNPQFDERRLRVGQKLRLLDLSDKSLRVEVHKKIYRLLVWRTLPGGTQPLLVACMPVGLGAPQSPTPEGSTQIGKRVLNPPWTNPDTKKVIPAGDPENVLGGYWIALDPAMLGTSGIGLHGFTGEPAKNWIEQPASHGCVRLLQPDIDRVFHLALEGTPVVITK